MEVLQGERKPINDAPMIAEDDADPIAERQAMELNSIMGVV